MCNSEIGESLAFLQELSSRVQAICQVELIEIKRTANGHGTSSAQIKQEKTNFRNVYNVSEVVNGVRKHK